MQSVCGACLCEERPLRPLSSACARRLYAHTLDQEPRGPSPDLPVGCEAVCWQCAARLDSFVRFQRQARTGHQVLLDALHDQSQGWAHACVARPPRLQVHCAPSVACDGHEEYIGFTDVSFQLKAEPEPPYDAYTELVKPEPVDIQMDVADRMDSDSVDGPLLEKPKKKKKRKKPKKSPQKKKPKKAQAQKTPEPIADDVSSDALSDLGSLLDLYEDEPPLSEPAPELDPAQVQVLVPVPAQVLQLSEAQMQAERRRLASSERFLGKQHKCMDCVRAFRSERALLAHRDTRHSESAGAHACPVCQVRFPEAASLAEHVSRHVRRLRCAECGRTCASRKAHAQHAQAHRKHQCHLCGELSGSQSAHQAHMSVAHAAARERPQCVECGKMFSSRKTYRYHLNVIHRGQNRFPCPHCGKVYQWKSNLWRHIKNHKARDSGELYCGECDKRFSSVATYQQHLKASRRHVAESDFSHACEECGRRFATKTRLRDHVDWDHRQKVNYRCPTCDKPFKSNTSLYVHAQNVHRAKGERANLCHVCGKSYQNLAKLKYHIVAMHTSQTPYACAQPHCGAAFSWYSSLYRHQREVHDKVKLKKPKKAKKDAAPEPAPAPTAAHGIPAIVHS